MNKEDADREKSPASSEWAALLKRADAGDVTALAEVRASFDQAPEKWQSIGSSFGDACFHVIETALKFSVESGVAAREAARRHLDALADGFAGRDAGPLERALAERAALAFYELDNLTKLLAVAHEAFGASGVVKSAETLAPLDRRRDRAHARAMSAARTLAVVRRLLSGKPTLAVGVQVNVGERPSTKFQDDPQAVAVGHRSSDRS